MKNLSLSLLRYLCGMMICAAPFAVSAQEVENETEKKPVERIAETTLEEGQYSEAGERAEGDEETLSAEEPSEEEIEEDQLAVKKAFAAAACSINNQFKAQATLFPSLKALEKTAAYFPATHSGIYLPYVGISDLWLSNGALMKNAVALGDNTIWQVRSGDAVTMYDSIFGSWRFNDVVVVSENHALFSSHAFRLHNKTTGVSVAVNLKLFPFPELHNAFNRIVVGFDDYLGILWLSDGSEWSVYPGDYSTKWAVGDTVVLGVNDGWFSTTRPNIIINANLLHTVRAACVN